MGPDCAGGPLGWGLVVLNVMAVGKVLAGVVSGKGTGQAMLVLAGVGPLVGDVVLVVTVRSRRGRLLRSPAAVG